MSRICRLKDLSVNSRCIVSRQQKKNKQKNKRVDNIRPLKVVSDSPVCDCHGVRVRRQDSELKPTTIIRCVRRDNKFSDQVLAFNVVVTGN